MDPRVEKVLKMPLYQRVLILLLLLGLIAGGFAYFFYIPAQDELSKQQKNNKKILVELQEKRRIANNLPRFKAEYEKMKKQLDLALNELPNESEIPSLLSNIAGLARDNGLEVVEFKPAKERPKGFYAEVPVSLKLVGTYHEMALFCEAVSNLARIVNINDLNLGKPKMSDGITQLSISNTVVTYRFVENPPEPKKKGRRK
ncbi:type 4a pilus biogenesis protein PilO [Desulfuromonas acetoxidans]|uniref:type 4a pilus biogenesis protein PilO n=1 Tax=Desulfuromonas acetoxidans TaxID=891 RepID=UPI0029318772|nr:type 4a pilus biogenesis protein PilO [Desulfuromonas acetoxidans]